LKACFFFAQRARPRAVDGLRFPHAKVSTRPPSLESIAFPIIARRAMLLLLSDSLPAHCSVCLDPFPVIPVCASLPFAAVPALPSSHTEVVDPGSPGFFHWAQLPRASASRLILSLAPWAFGCIFPRSPLSPGSGGALSNPPLLQADPRLFGMSPTLGCACYSRRASRVTGVRLNVFCLSFAPSRLLPGVFLRCRPDDRHYIHFCFAPG